MIVAIDGPAGSGKTTIAKCLARRLNILYLDTGATYRALTLHSLNSGFNLSDQDVLAKAASNISIQFENNAVILNGSEVTEEIRSPRIDKNISVVVKHPKVREVMVSLQRKIGEQGNYVIEGRDITTVVFPNAEFKFYLDADTKLRARRRHQELLDKGISLNFNEVLSDLEKRDYADINREVGRLRLSDDAIYIDTTELSVDEVIETLAGFIEK